jgi:hypothetical protein
VTLFTVHLELGPETRAMIERLATNATIHFEFGSKTIAILERLFPTEATKGDGASLLRKGAEALRNS